MAYGVQISQFLTGGEMLVGDLVAGLRTVNGVLNDYKFNFPGTGIKDPAGNYLLRWIPGVGVNTNYIEFNSASSGRSAIVTTGGGDTNVNMTISAQGLGIVTIAGTSNMVIPGGTAGQALASVGGGLRYNFTTQYIDYWSTVSNSWVDLTSGSALSTLTYVTNTNETAFLPNSQPLSTLATGFMASTTATGIVATRHLVATANQINISTLDGSANPTFSLSSTLIFPGTAAVDNGLSFTFFDSTGVGFAAFEAPVATYSSNATYQWPVAGPVGNGYILGATTAGIMSWIDPATIGGVTSVSGTANQIVASPTTGAVVLTLSSTLIAPGTVTVNHNLTATAGIVSLSADASDNAVNIGTGASSGRTITIGNTTGSTGIIESVGTGEYSLDGVGASTYRIGASTTTGTINIGGTAQTGTITLGSSSGTSIVAIGAGAGQTTVNIANNATTGAVNIGSAATTATITIGGSAATGTITLGSSTGTNTVAIASGIGTGLINIGTGAIGVKTINIGTGNAANIVTIGAAVGAASLTLNSGSGGIIATGVAGVTVSNQKFVTINSSTGALGATTAPSGNTLSQSIHQVAHGFSVQQVLYLNGSTYTLAEANSVAAAEVVGIVTAVADADNFTITFGGYINTFTSVTAGVVYFLSDATPGLLTATQPTTVGNVSKPLFIADSTTSGYLFNWRGKIIPSPATGGTVTNVSGTANQIAVASATTTPVISIVSNAILPGTGGVTLPTGNTAARAGGAGTIRFNSQTTLFETTVDGSTWTNIGSGTGSGTVSSGSINQLAWYAANGTTVSGLSTANSSVLVTSSGGVPSLSTTLPTGMTINAPIMTGSWNNSGATSIQFNNQGYVAAKDFYAQGDGVSANGRVFIVNANGSHQGNITVANNAADRTWTMPDASGTVALTSGASGIVSSGTINQLAWYAASGTTVSGLSTANSSVLVTSGGGVPSLSTTLPSGLTITAPTMTGSWSSSGSTSIQLNNQGYVAAKDFYAQGDSATVAGRIFLLDVSGNQGNFIAPSVSTSPVWTMPNATGTVAFISAAINTQTNDYTLVLADAGKIVEMNKGSANTLTVPTNASVAFVTGTMIDIVQFGAGKTTVAAAGGVTIESQAGNLSLAAQYAGASLYKRGTDDWVLVGNLIA